ncbi:MAG: hypothetical protein LLF94_02945 [Chlamydiales bacterium]|nr:hypothetical protein [Chlamydiales bacterium]
MDNVDLTKTFKALDEYNNDDGSKRKRLKVVETTTASGRTYHLEFVPLSGIKKVVAFFRGEISNFKLNKVLNIVKQTGEQKADPAEKGVDQEITLMDFTKKLTGKVREHYVKTPEITRSKVEEITNVEPQLSLEAAKRVFKTEAKTEKFDRYLRGHTPAYNQLQKMVGTILTTSGLDATCKQMVAEKKEAKAILSTIVEHLENLKNPEVLEVGTAIKDSVATRVGEDGSPVKDAAAFTVGAFFLRQGPTLLPISDSHGKDISKAIQRMANDYSLRKDQDKEIIALLDRLSVVLTGSKPTIGVIYTYAR